MVNTITFDLEIYTYDIDFAGFVSPIAYSHWLEIAWLKLLDAVALPRYQLAIDNWLPLLAQSQIQYSQPLTLGDRVQAELWVTQLDAALVELQVRFSTDRQTTVAEATQQWVFTDRQTRSPKALGSALSSVFQPYLRSPNPPN
jgi:acyl-CoA thioester hydrolase